MAATGRYATSTDVPADRTRGEIERLLVKYGADQFMFGSQRGGTAVAPEGMGVVMFTMRDRQVRIVVPMPSPAEFATTETGRPRRSEAAQLQAWEQATRQRWRALLLVIKAKLEAVEVGISTFEREFLAHLVTDRGTTVGDELGDVDRVLAHGPAPLLQLGRGHP